MKARKIKDRIYWMGSVDWDRRLFDSLVPLPDGTSYNAYLIEGSEKTVQDRTPMLLMPHFWQMPSGPKQNSFPSSDPMDGEGRP